MLWHILLKKTVKTVLGAPPVKFILNILGSKPDFIDPEVNAWANIIHRIKSALVGAQFGAIAQVVLDLLNKLFYRIELTARYKYPIPHGNVVLDMLALSNNAATVISKGSSYAMLKYGSKGYKKDTKALINKMRELEQLAISQQLQIEQDKSKKQTFPFPAHQALELPKTSPQASPKVSSDPQYNPNLTSGSEAEDEGGMVNTKPKGKSKAKSSGGSFIKGQVLKPIKENYIIGKAHSMPYNDLENDSFLIKPRRAETVI